MMIKPSAELSLDLYADFAGLWNSKNPDDSMAVKS
jgi:hypothetical protein